MEHKSSSQLRSQSSRCSPLQGQPWSGQPGAWSDFHGVLQQRANELLAWRGLWPSPGLSERELVSWIIDACLSKRLQKTGGAPSPPISRRKRGGGGSVGDGTVWADFSWTIRAFHLWSLLPAFAIQRSSHFFASKTLMNGLEETTNSDTPSSGKNRHDADICKCCCCCCC